MLALLAGLASTGAAGAPLRARDRASTSEWRETRAQGGGVEFDFSRAQVGKGNDAAWKFLSGATLRFRLGCNSFDAAKSQWQFRVEVSAPRAGITGTEELAYEAGVERTFNQPGSLTLIDEMDKPMKRLSLQPGPRGLSSEILQPDEVRAFLDASAIRVDTPTLELESGTLWLARELNKLRPGLPCARR